MKGDFSRLRFNTAKNYTSVLEQQGRVALDADANEQSLINSHLRRTETSDLIGDYGGPQSDTGFAIRIVNNDILIGAGHYYVKGIFCENPSEISYGQQAFLINPPLTAKDLLGDLQAGQYTAIQLYLEVWERLVTSLDDLALTETALGKTDTTLRLQTVFRVVANPISTQPSDTKCCENMYQNTPEIVPGTMAAKTAGGSSDCSCQPTPSAGYRGLENQLYRVEIHTSGNAEAATFKWSRENGSVITSVTQVSGSSVNVDNLGFDANLGFATGNWVEIRDDSYTFGYNANQPGELCQINSISAGHPPLLGLSTQISAIKPENNAQMRRWDQYGPGNSTNGIPLPINDWLELENGIKIQFQEGNYVSGDYWLIPARTATGNIEWPPLDSDGQFYQPPHNTSIYRAPLACVHWDTGQEQFTVEDCRRFFPSLVDTLTDIAMPALHITSFDWNNDDLLTLDILLKNGLNLTFDQAITGHIDSGGFSVTLEIANEFVSSYLDGKQTLSYSLGQLPVSFRTSMPLDGNITVSGNQLSWSIPLVNIQLTNEGGQGNWSIVSALNLLLQQGSQAGCYTRVRVKLSGDKIFSGTQGNYIYLDGQAFAKPGFRQDGATARTDLNLPTGTKQKASDFDSWFYLTPTLNINIFMLTVSSVVLTSSSTLPQIIYGEIWLNFPAIADTIIHLSIQYPVAPAGVDVPNLQALTLPANTVTATKNNSYISFPLTINNTGTTTPLVYTVFAVINDAIGMNYQISTTLTITGFINPIRHPIHITGLNTVEKINPALININNNLNSNSNP